MASSAFKGWGMGLVVLGLGTLASAETVPLHETARVGETTRVVVALKADGLYQPGLPPDAKGGERPKALALKVETRLNCAERVLAITSSGRARRVVRKVVEAGTAINGEVRPMAATIRPEVALLVAELRAGTVVVFSPGGLLTRPELELVQGAGDPLTLAALLPEKRVGVGDRWQVGGEAARALSGYDALASNALGAVLESIDDASALIRLKGEVRGAVLGGEGVIICSGSCRFDRKAGRIDRLDLTRSEIRKPGPVEAGLDIKSTLTVERRAVEPPAELADAALAGVSLQADPQRELLRLISPDGKYTLRHDRDWHTYWDDTRLTVLKRLDQGEVIAQCNLAAGPNAGRGRHQDLNQFRDDIRGALGKRFAQFVGAGEVEGDPAGGFRYKVGVQGREGDLNVLWNYYLVASPEGDQLLVTFTLAETQAKTFGDQDLGLVGSLQWTGPSAPAPKP